MHPILRERPLLYPLLLSLTHFVIAERPSETHCVFLLTETQTHQKKKKKRTLRVLMMNMMDQLHEKTEVASGFVAGGEAELGLVTVQGDKTQATTNHGSGSDPTGSTRHDLVSAVSGFGVLRRKKRMARQRRSSSSTIKLLSFVPSSSTSHVPSSPLPGLPTLPARVSFKFLFFNSFPSFYFTQFLCGFYKSYCSVFDICCSLYIKWVFDFFASLSVLDVCVDLAR